MPDVHRTVSDLTALLRADCAQGRVIDRLPSHPNSPDIAALIDRLNHLLLPDPADREALSARMTEVLRLLTEQITLALGMAFPPAVCPPDERAHALAADFLSALPEVRASLLADLNAAFEGDPAAASPEEIALCYPGFHALLVHRMAHRLHTAGIPLLPRMMAEVAHERTGIDIHPGASIGRACFIDHGAGVVIGETAVIGDDAKLYHGVTLGALSTRGGQSLRGRKRHPTLGDRVTVYAGATVLGGGTYIGDGAVIGANALVTASVPAGARISAAVPAVPLASGGN